MSSNPMLYAAQMPQVAPTNPMMEGRPTADPLDQTANYNTPLTPQEEAAFQAWAAQDPKRLGDLYDYDVRGFWKAGGHTAKNGHGSDNWKKPNHPTFSNQSIYSGPYTPGGQWDQQKSGFSFTPALGNPRAMDASDEEVYWNRIEAPMGNTLLPPQQLGRIK